MIDSSEIKEIIEIIKKLETPFYIHAGFALYLQGFDSEIDDCDIRIYHQNIKEIYDHLKKHSKYKIKLRGSIPYEKGIYDNQCIEIQNKTNFDICSRMKVD